MPLALSSRNTPRPRLHGLAVSLEAIQRIRYIADMTWTVETVSGVDAEIEALLSSSRDAS